MKRNCPQSGQSAAGNAISAALQQHGAPGLKLPVFQLAWIAERFRDWTAGDVPHDTVDRDALLTNVMLYWLTDTAAS